MAQSLWNPTTAPLLRLMKIWRSENQVRKTNLSQFARANAILDAKCSVAMKLEKRKRVNSEVSQQGLCLGDDENHQAAWVNVPTRRERPVSLGSPADRSPSSLSVKRTHKRQKIQVWFPFLHHSGAHILSFLSSRNRKHLQVVGSKEVIPVNPPTGNTLAHQHSYVNGRNTPQ